MMNISNSLSNDEEPSPKLIRWTDLIKRFRFDVIHIDRDKNTIADMFSRDGRFEVDWDKFLDKVRLVIKKDKEWIKTIKQRDDVKEHDGILYLLDEATETKRLISVDKRQITRVLSEAQPAMQVIQNVGKNRIEQEKHVVFMITPASSNIWLHISAVNNLSLSQTGHFQSFNNNNNNIETIIFKNNCKTIDNEFIIIETKLTNNEITTTL
ncbi:hypothetical protein ACTA71_005362 [Dictyostelium dimigraforme]